MGSFQQISIGIVCLVAAFMFGNYVNNHPHPDHVTNAFNDLESDVNPASPTSLLEPGKTIQRSAPIATMQSKQSARYPQLSLFKGSINNGFENAATEEKDGSLPPPSQLGTTSPFEDSFVERRVGEIQSEPELANPESGSREVNDSRLSGRMPNLRESAQRREIVVPDFSQLASGFRDTALALPGHNRKGSIQRTMNGRDQITSLSPHTPLGQIPQPDNRPNNSRLGSNLASGGIANQPATNQARSVKTIPSEFSQAQFEPSLKDYSVNKSSGLNAQTSASQMDAREFVSDHSKVDSPVAGNREVREIPSGNVRSLQGEYFTAESESNPMATNTPTVPVNLPYDRSWNTNKPPQASLQSVDRRPSKSSDKNSGAKKIQAQFAAPPVPSADNETHRAAKPLIPFGLTQTERKNLVRLQRPTQTNRIDVGTTRFESYTSQPGDSLQDLSTRYYGRPDFYLDIYLANKSRLRNPGYLPAGIELQIPIY